MNIKGILTLWHQVNLLERSNNYNLKGDAIIKYWRTIRKYLIRFVMVSIHIIIVYPFWQGIWNPYIGYVLFLLEGIAIGLYEIKNTNKITVYVKGTPWMCIALCLFSMESLKIKAGLGFLALLLGIVMEYVELTQKEKRKK